MICSDISASVAYAEAHIEKCIRDQPSMKAELEGALAAWNRRNLKHVQDAQGRSDYTDIVELVRSQLDEEGHFTIEHCAQVIKRAHSEERDIETRLSAERRRV